MPGADDRAALGDRRERLGHELAGGSEDDRGVQLLRPLADGAGPLGADLAGERLRRVVAGSREGEHTPPFVDRQLRDDVGGGAEPVEAEDLAVAGCPQSAVADQPRTEERRKLLVGGPIRKRQAVARVGDGLLGVASVERVAGEARPVAQILAPGPAVAARAAGPTQPRNADPRAHRKIVTFDDGADDLVAEDEGQLRVGQLAVANVEIGPADAAGTDADPHLARPKLRAPDLGFPELRSRCIEQHRPHGRMLTRARGPAPAPAGRARRAGSSSPTRCRTRRRP